MKRLTLLLSLVLVLILSQLSFGQLARDSWSFGFGFSYPRFMSTDVRPQDENYGAYITLQRNFSENVALRGLARYAYIKGRVPGFDPATNRYYYTNGTKVPSVTEYMNSMVISGGLDILYYFVPCSDVSPYIGIGLAGAYMDPQWPDNVRNPEVEKKSSAQFNFTMGSEWRVGDAWKLVTEFGYHSLDGQVDGVIDNNRRGIFGSSADGYVTFNLGLNYYFSKGEPSHLCELYSGIKVSAPQQNYPTLDQIEELIEKHIPKEVVKQVVVEKPAPAAKKNWILFGINFKFDKATLMPEAYPILQHAAQVLKENPGMKVEIEGYTDNIGTEAYNQKLSVERATTVKNYLVKEGISADRLTTVGFGESNPVADNSTAVGRAKNRRIEFKVLDR